MASSVTAVNDWTVGTGLENVVQKDGERGDVIQVSVGKNNVLHPFLDG